MNVAVGAYVGSAGEGFSGESGIWPGWAHYYTSLTAASKYRQHQKQEQIRQSKHRILQELVGSSPSQKNWRGIAIALLVILIVCSLIVVAVILVTPKTEETEIGANFTFEDVFDPDYKPRVFTAQWIADKDIYTYQSREGELMKYDANKNSSVPLMDNSTFRNLNTDVSHVSETLKFVLIAYDIDQIYRHSQVARYVIYSLTGSDRRPIPFPQSLQEEWKERKLQYAGWAPKGDALSFVYKNNLYYQPDPLTTPTQVTDNGRYRAIFNGIPDWLYEEEIMHSNTAHWWSPEATHIAYAQFNDTDVKVYNIPVYGQGTDIYGYPDGIAYPKAGDPSAVVNPTVKLFIVDTSNLKGKHRYVKPPEEFINKEHYVTMVQWRDNGHLLVGWSNRAQNRTIITLCDVKSMDCSMNLVEDQKLGRGWVQIEKVHFIDNGEQYLTILPQNDGDYGYWNHIARVTCNMRNWGQRFYLTQGLWDVTEILAYNERDNYVYFLSPGQDPRKRHLYRQSVAHTVHEPQCMSCGIEGCEYVSASFSKSSHYYILNCLGPDVPSSILRSTITDLDIMVEDNAEVRVRLQKKALPKPEFFEFEVSPGLVLHGQMYLPPILRKDHITQYPLLVHTYGGPNTQLVTEEFKIGWSTYLGSTENIIYASIDGRGASGRGLRFMHATYRNLGGLEVQDQIAGARYLKQVFRYVDKERIGIWGWSYGGFVTAHALGDDDQDVFNCGISVAPVTDWRYYDTAYTERYMGFANSQDNYRGYDNANVSRKAHNFKGKTYLIVHGTADDNVHFQHTAQFTKALTEAEADYRIQVYADNNHALSGEHTSRHLHRTMTSFLKRECWNGGKPRDVLPPKKKKEEKS